MTVVPEGEGGFQKVAIATGSPLITGPVSLAALWASLPGLSNMDTLPGSPSPRPIDLLAEESTSRRPQATLFLADMPAEQSAWLKRFGEIMAAYPGAAGCAIPMQGNPINAPEEPGNRWAVDVRWPAQEASGDMSREELRAFFDKIAPAYRYRSDRYLRPAIDGNAPPSPLMTWWLLLYSFSILARYEPRRWTKLLDLDKTETAVLLQYALAEALTAVPHLVLEALDGEPFLLAKPMAF